MHELNTLANLGNQHQRDSIRNAEIAAGIYAANRVANHMQQVEAQNAAMLHQMWVQTELMSGRSMDDINKQIDHEAAQQRDSDSQSFMAGVFGVFSLVAGALVYSWSGYNGWLGILTVLVVFAGPAMLWGSASRHAEELESSSIAEASEVHRREAGHTEWVANFQAEQARRLKDVPPTD